ncbi:hypothetical protein C8P66_11982 [Humitalea rosea]|uniref:Uncharacterized protein n=1 Tax=Humitalea rosea TaxID=990373 RepID=A0A2W7K3J3_9PROT|nr:hypothetical protein [Humitalea rosea]PZW42190.1 hypothetical protein C8P66_11982 [Humitalea rosea]
MSASSSSSSTTGRGDDPPSKRQRGDGHIAPLRTRTGQACGAVIDERPACAPVGGHAGPALPAHFHLNERSLVLLQRGTVNNAFSGVVNVRTGEITIHPLADEAYDGGDRTFSRHGDGYPTSRFPGGLPAGSPLIEDTPARPLPPGGHRGRSMSVPGPPRHVEPITHMDPDWQGEVSHEQIARRVGGIPAPAGPHGDTYSRFVGFTVWIGPVQDTQTPTSLRPTGPMVFRLVCTSRALNTPKFGAGGKMTRAWAERLRAAFDNARLPRPYSADDLGLLSVTEDMGGPTG